MFGFDIPLWAPLVAGGAWWLLRKFRPTWAAKLRYLEAWARESFWAVERGASAYGWKGPEKFRRLRSLVGRKASAYGVKLGQRELDYLQDLAEEWSLEAKASAEELQAALEKLAAMGDELAAAADRANTQPGR